jgi:hypothetical protein
MLKNLQTDLKSLKFGHDRIGGGSSNQPYITSPIPDKIGEYGFLNTDFLLRGGSKAVTNSLTDVVRLGKYFSDVRNPSGLLFVAKQNLLSRMAVRTQASGFLLNEGVYTPLSTLIEAGGVAFGLHVNKQGLNPFGGFGGITKYEDIIRLATDESVFDSHDRLSVLYGYKIINDESTLSYLNGIKINSGGVNVLSYAGGPGSFLGIGKTNIKFAGSSASERTGLNNPNLKGSSFFNGQSTKYGTLNQDYSVFKKPTYTNINGTYLLGVSRIQGIEISKNGFNVDGQVVGEFRQVGQLNTVDKNVSGSIDSLYNPVYTQQQLNNIPTDISIGGFSSYIGKNGITTPNDFRKLLRKGLTSDTQKNAQSLIGNLINAPNYAGKDAKNIEKRLFLGDPGNRNGKNLTSYTSGSSGQNGAASSDSYDKITASEIDDDFQNDLVKFRIEVVDNDTPSNTTKLQFRAFLNTISDQYSADWNPTKYLGRGENFYTYGGFDRKVSLSWTVAAQSKKELIPMYKKLNYLASVCAPDYSGEGYMRGNLVKLTVGGYFFEQYGIITGLSYEMNDDSATWEIGINDEGGYDETVKELPHLIKVSSFNFIPIHDFVPRKVQALTGTTERFIALEATGNNY